MINSLGSIQNYSRIPLSQIEFAADSLLEGNLVAFPTETVYGLGSDASNSRAVDRIYKVKGRPIDHPLIVHISCLAMLNNWAADIPDYALRLASFFWPGPMTLILPRTSLAQDFITGGQNNIGIRVPAHSVAQDLLKRFEAKGGMGVAAPSANRFGKVSPTCSNDVKNELSEFLDSEDLILDGGSSLIGLESTIIDCTNDFPVILRPGAITSRMVKELLGEGIKVMFSSSSNDIKAPGLLKSHYAPAAKLYFTEPIKQGDGFLALSKFSTPAGLVRLASPQNNKEFAKVLYRSLRLADSQNLNGIFVILPEGDDIAVAICDRLQKASLSH
jgi:L-threonylcarbamoyladenylate synthase